MAQTTAPGSVHERSTNHEIAVHMIAAAARILLMLGTAILVGEVAAGPAKRLLSARAGNHPIANEDGEPAD